MELVDKIATPHVKKYLTDMTFKSLNAYPTPKDYTEILDMRALPPPFLLSHSFHRFPLVNAAVEAPAPLVEPVAEGLHRERCPIQPRMLICACTECHTGLCTKSA